MAKSPATTGGRPYRQMTDSVLMIPPRGIRSNPETAIDNRFQRDFGTDAPSNLSQQALQEFADLTEQLQAAGVQVVVPDVSDDRDTPDAVFPNNWISFHEDGRVVLYPMRAANRRLERRPEVLGHIRLARFAIREVVDFSSWESEGIFLEGTGSLVIDRVNRQAYAGLSPRTIEEGVRRWCRAFDYEPIVFQAQHTVDGAAHPIYHTNVMMAVGETLAVVCLESITESTQRARVADQLAASGRELIEIDLAQMDRFAGNILQLQAGDGAPLTLISQTAFESLRASQRHALSRGSRLMIADVAAIESCGGGSVRCMIAEIFLPRSE